MSTFVIVFLVALGISDVLATALLFIMWVIYHKDHKNSSAENTENLHEK